LADHKNATQGFDAKSRGADGYRFRDLDPVHRVHYFVLETSFSGGEVASSVRSAIDPDFLSKQKVRFATTVLSISLVFAGLEVPFHPTVAGLVVTVVSAASLYLLAVWGSRRYP
jgi:hypothetical protein